MGKRAGLAHEHELAGGWLDPAESARQGPRGHPIYDDRVITETCGCTT